MTAKNSIYQPQIKRVQQSTPLQALKVYSFTQLIHHMLDEISSWLKL